MEYVIGPVVALLISGGFSFKRTKDLNRRIDELEEHVEYVQQKMAANEEEMPRKIMATISPVVRSVREIHQTIGM